MLSNEKPAKNSAGFAYNCFFDSIFKDYSDPDYPRSDVKKLCVLLSGGVSAIITAPLLIFTYDPRTFGALQPPAFGTAQAEYLP